MSSSVVIFDCDGVLIDSEAIGARVEVEELRRLGCAISLEQYLHVALGRTEEEEVWSEIASGSSVSLPHDFAAETRRKVAEAFTRELRAIPGIEVALQTLPCRTCVASGSRMDRLRRNLDLCGLAPFFDDRVYSATQVARGKPFPDLFLFVAERMGVASADCLVVEDSPAGVEAAVAAGMTVFGFAGGSHFLPSLGDRLLKAGARLLFEQMEELPWLYREHSSEEWAAVR